MTQEEKAKWMNKLVGDELIAHLQYTIAAHVVVGTDYDSSKAEFEQHAADELEHMNTLLEKMIQEHLPVDQDLISLIKNSYSGYEEMKGQSSKDLLLFHHQAEINAIKSYKAFLRALGNEDYGLKQKLRSILNDELEHRTDLEKVLSSVQNTKTLIPTEESALFSQHWSRKFSSLDRLMNFANPPVAKPAEVRKEVRSFNAYHQMPAQHELGHSTMDQVVASKVQNDLIKKSENQWKGKQFLNNLNRYTDTIKDLKDQQNREQKFDRLGAWYGFDPYEIYRQVRFNPLGKHGDTYNTNKAISAILGQG